MQRTAGGFTVTRPWFQAAFGSHYPTIYSHRDDAEARQCLELLPDLGPLGGPGPILDLGCGQGRHLRQLAAQGLPVVGLDLSLPLLDQAMDLWPNRDAPLIQGDMRWLPFQSGSFDSVLSLFTAFGYFGVLSRNKPVIEEVARVLAPGGHWFLDYVDCDSVRGELENSEPRPRRREIGPLLVEETRQLTEGGQLVEKTVAIKPVSGQEADAMALEIPPSGVSYTEQVALFSPQEMEQLAGQCGLELVASAGSYDGLPLGQGKRWIFSFCRQQGVGS